MIAALEVRKSLSSNKKFSYVADLPDKRAISEAFKATVSRKFEGGTGLTIVRQSVIDLGGTLYFASDSGYLRVDEEGKSYIGSRTYNYPGVQMRVGFSTRRG